MSKSARRRELTAKSQRPLPVKGTPFRRIIIAKTWTDAEGVEWQQPYHVTKGYRKPEKTKK